MGYYVGGSCVTEDAHMASIPTMPGVNALYRVEKVAGVWSLVQYGKSGSAMVVTGSATIPTAGLVTCDQAQPFFDGMTVGWALAVVLVLAWGFLRMMRAAR